MSQSIEHIEVRLGYQAEQGQPLELGIALSPHIVAAAIQILESTMMDEGVPRVDRVEQGVRVPHKHRATLLISYLELNFDPTKDGWNLPHEGCLAIAKAREAHD